MPDPTGFLKYGRQLPLLRPVPERVTDWRDVYQRADPQLIHEQASRCMNCGVPYCHNGCPLGNLIPDWNDLVRTGEWARAADTLHATNNFPEVTGRLCPAPCEAACVLGIGDDPVTIKQVEVEIINHVTDDGPLPPFPVAPPSGHSVGVVGSGPAGLAAAQQLARAGHAVTVYERGDAPGGLLRYGIPDFKFEKHHIDRRLAQMSAEGVTFVTGCEVGVDVSLADLRQRHDAVVLACGALDPRDVPDTPGRELSGIHQAMEYLEGANKVVAGTLDAPPITAAGRHVIVVGGGDTAADCLGTAHRQGAVSVQLVEVAPLPPPQRDASRNPWPTWPIMLRSGSAHEEGGERNYGCAIRRFIGDEQGRLRAVELVDVVLGPGFTLTEVEGTDREIPADLALLAIGFAGTQPGPHLEQAELTRNRRGTLDTDAGWQTSAPGVFVAGDARRGPSLIVWAIAEGRSAAAAVHQYLGGGGRLPAPITPSSAPLTAH
ncbi:glutamate synthase subunit beta [Dactylosporangium aurantiacum]|uniref:Glutamate synthase subunit beta n=1 Tax=Dactylosporangium aurantiacum TaxID=35754 RepID=A0A9Q9IB91_9ACTN|nr:glutamate synthase subunit beta [Dactylosporangium aurantiacum]MDG6109670.1 glutamate synthase subunit beta [Dactylosporangium aurantiacum]UWZ50284.1 glutamate synthase subunit beta [Dactylosporangium aurantiacum]